MRDEQSLFLFEIDISPQNGFRAQCLLTKRDLFAIKAMQGLLLSGLKGELYRPKECAEFAVNHADALIAELNKKTP